MPSLVVYALTGHIGGAHRTRLSPSQNAMCVSYLWSCNTHSCFGFIVFFVGAKWHEEYICQGVESDLVALLEQWMSLLGCSVGEVLSNSLGFLPDIRLHYSFSLIPKI
jgi:hypothetical protein